MTSPMVIPESRICDEKRRLTNAVLEAAHSLTTLHDREMSLLLNGKRAERFDLAIIHARRKREEAKRALSSHTLAHGC